MPAARLARLAALLALACALAARAQDSLQLDDLGNTVVVSVVTDAAGAPLDTTILSTLTTATDAADTATDTDTAAAAATETTETTTTPTTTAAATETTTEPNNLGQPAQVITPASRCTTAGCPVAPTTYTANGAIVTWYATTPATPIPQVTSSGQIVGVGSYISSVSTATGNPGGAAATPGVNPNSNKALSGAPSSRWGGNRGDWALAAGVALVGGLVGVVAVL
ncbi:hypothetical protein JCM3775_006595 [Rhodotorula graminis]